MSNQFMSIWNRDVDTADGAGVDVIPIKSGRRFNLNAEKAKIGGQRASLTRHAKKATMTLAPIPAPRGE